MTSCFVFYFYSLQPVFIWIVRKFVCATNFLVYFCAFWPLIFNKKLDFLFVNILFISSCFILSHCSNSLFWYPAGFSVVEFPRLQRLLTTSICFFSIHRDTINAWLIICMCSVHSLVFYRVSHCVNSLLLHVVGFSVVTFPRLQSLLPLLFCFFSIRMLQIK